ncbi:NUDIX hydrolase domain-like protein [Flagelloscypha sp. PMI_526]|nr:NUDIX hydrolase domain-like protein [Flagelloscypha sp. PMI_526]
MVYVQALITSAGVPSSLIMRFVLDIPDIPASSLSTLTEPSRICIERLTQSRFNDPHLEFPSETKLAAVLVLIFEKDDHLRVLLTTRSKELRTHSGQTALPGGKVDEPPDTSFLDTALREAHEEVSLPLAHSAIHPIGLMQPFISAFGLIVAPVVAFLSDPSVLDLLQAYTAEVSDIFTHPLEAVLDPSLMTSQELVAKGSEHWHYPEELHNTTDHVIESLAGLHYRMHRFRSSLSPVKGLTADIMIKVAELAYQKPPQYDRYAPGQPHGPQEILELVQGIRAQRQAELQKEK